MRATICLTVTPSFSDKTDVLAIGYSFKTDKSRTPTVSRRAVRRPGDDIIGRELNRRKPPGRQWETNPQPSEQLMTIKIRASAETASAAYIVVYTELAIERLNDEATLIKFKNDIHLVSKQARTRISHATRRTSFEIKLKIITVQLCDNAFVLTLNLSMVKINTEISCRGQQCSEQLRAYIQANHHV